MFTGVNLLDAVPRTPNADFGGEEESSVEDGVAANCLSELQGKIVIRHRGGFFGEVDTGRSYEDVG